MACWPSCLTIQAISSALGGPTEWTDFQTMCDDVLDLVKHVRCQFDILKEAASKPNKAENAVAATLANLVSTTLANPPLVDRHSDDWDGVPRPND